MIKRTMNDDMIKRIYNPDVYSYSKLFNKDVLRHLDLDTLSQKQLHEVCMETQCDGHRKLKGKELLNLTKKCVSERIKTPSPRQLGSNGFPLKDLGKGQLIDIAESLGINVGNMTRKQIISAILMHRGALSLLSMRSTDMLSPLPSGRRTLSPSAKRSPSKRRSPPKRVSPLVSPSKMSVVQLKAMAKRLSCKGYSTMRKVELSKFVRVCKPSSKLRKSPRRVSPRKSPRRVSPRKSPLASPSKMTVVQLKALAKKFDCQGYSKMRKVELVSFVKTCKMPTPRRRSTP